MTHDNAGTGCQQTETFSIRIGDDESFDERFVFDDPVPTGRQILQKAGRRPVQHQLLLLTNDGQLEEIGLEETVDLRTRGVEKFFVFKTDRLFQFVIDDRRFSWGGTCIKESTLKFLAGVSDEYTVWQECRGEQGDRRIEPGTSACLTGEGVELFFTGKDQTNAG